jgi:hypothetical protein
MTFINEFPHPQYVINYDPEPDTEPYGFDVLDDAITHRAHAIELHALYRQSDNSVVWAHNSDSIDQSKLASKLGNRAPQSHCPLLYIRALVPETKITSREERTLWLVKSLQREKSRSARVVFCARAKSKPHGLSLCHSILHSR